MATSQQIIDVDPDEKWLLNKENLEQILLRDEVKNLPVVVISIVGTYRQGKSFILNFLLRFLIQTCKENKSVEDWLNPVDGPLSGFVWKKCAKRDTVGICMWSEVFISQLPSGEKVAIVLLDTQGTHDNYTDVNDFASIFSLSTLISSVQVYNLMNRISQNDLTSLKGFLDYGRLVNEANSEETPFQDLLFLIRDWVNFEEFKYGEDGGQKYLEGEIGVKENQSPDVTALKTSIQQFFSKIFGFLLPGPGSKVVLEATKNLEEMDDKFKTHVKLLVEKILKPENLTVKEVNGKKLKVSDLYILIEKYWEVFQNGEMPRIESVFQATAEVQHHSAAANCIQMYTSEISQIFDEVNVLLKMKTAFNFEATELKDRHEETKKATLEKFNKIKKLGDKATTDKYRVQLTLEIDAIFTEKASDLLSKCKEEGVAVATLTGLVACVAYLLSKTLR